jgi:mono/diheme cytochrome c family protein
LFNLHEILPARSTDRLDNPGKPLEMRDLTKTQGSKAAAFLFLWLGVTAQAAEPRSDAKPVTAAVPALAQLERDYRDHTRPMFDRFCGKCHSTEVAEADIDLEKFKSMADIRHAIATWQKVAVVIAKGEMPPPDAKQPEPEERKALRDWVTSYLAFEAREHAGDPGRVLLRRLNNAEYTNTIRDLTGVATLDPAREFPVDGAAGEGFTNTGNSLVMSPALVTKYLDAAKQIADHAVLLPDGFRFSTHKTPRDWTNDRLDEIRNFYYQFTDSGGGDQVNLQGIVLDTNKGGRLSVQEYVRATLEERDALSAHKKTINTVAHERRLNPKYLGRLWELFSANQVDFDDPKARRPSLLLDSLRAHWKAAKPADAAAVSAEINQWQQALWRFTSVGHIGKVGGPKAWVEPVSPLTSRQEFKLKLPASTNGKDVTLYLTATGLGDTNSPGFALWDRPRIVAPGRPDLLLRDLRPMVAQLHARRDQLFAVTAKCLNAAAEASATDGRVDVAKLASKYQVNAESLVPWLDYLGIASEGPVKLGTPLSRKIEGAATYDFIKGWVGDDALSLLANSSDRSVRIPGNMRPHSIAVHPSPSLSVAVGWRSPVHAELQISGAVQHAHPECGNGVAWSLELRRGNTRERLATGKSQGGTKIAIGPLTRIAVRPGDVISLAISPRDGNHSCDLTLIDLNLKNGTTEWDMARELSPAILAGNPHNDTHGHDAVWSFFSEPATGSDGFAVPAGTLLARWRQAGNAADKGKLALEIEKLLRAPTPPPKGAADAVLYEQLTSMNGPLMAALFRAIASGPHLPAPTGTTANTWGVDPSVFGKHPSGSPIEPASICVQAPSVIEVRIPADLATGAELVTVGSLDPATAPEAAAQFQVLSTRPNLNPGLQPTAAIATDAGGTWTSNNRGVSYSTPVVVAPGSAASQRIESAFADFRSWFPAALCYTKIVPVDEVVTLTLYYREDHQLQRLMLDDAQKAKLDRLWSELHFISQDALTLVDVLDQLIQYATQDGDPGVFLPLRKPFQERANAFKKWLVDTEPKHLDAVLEFAGRAYRRPLKDAEAQELIALYQSLRKQEIPHQEAIRLLLARVLVAPAFLYRIEKPGAGSGQGPVSNFELASRLSYFLWSSQPDQELINLAARGTLARPEVLRAQMNRMLKDPRTRRLAIEFACQWLHINDFDHLDEKSERHFPTFASVRAAMYEESIQFFQDLFQNNRSLLDIVDADYTFLNGPLAAHYGIPGIKGDEWRRVDGMRKHARGGILAQATTLAKHSGASRTSPILRGDWLSEVVLGDKLPRPPKNVPQLPESVPNGLTERQLIERHSSDAACMKCHARIDPYGYALENFDAIGRFRDKDAAGLAIDSRTTLPDGTKIDGLNGLRAYLLGKRRVDVLRQFDRKLLGFALGRSVQLSDDPLLDEMTTTLEQNQYKVLSAIEAIVLSRQFREIRGRETAYDD